MTDFLPFARPSIDEETIAGVAEVLRSGWITSGPQVKAFEAALSRLCGGRAVRSFSSGTAALEVGPRLAGGGPRERGNYPPPFLGAPPPFRVQGRPRPGG